MAATIAEADPEQIRTGDVEELTKQFAGRFALDAPTLIEGALTISIKEIAVDRSQHYRRDGIYEIRSKLDIHS